MLLLACGLWLPFRAGLICAVLNEAAASRDTGTTKAPRPGTGTTEEARTAAEQPNCHSQTCGERGLQRARWGGREQFLGDVGPIFLAPDDRSGADESLGRGRDSDAF